MVHINATAGSITHLNKSIDCSKYDQRRKDDEETASSTKSKHQMRSMRKMK